MKKTVFLLSIMLVTKVSFGQVTAPDSTKKEFKNIVEVDATALLHQIVNLNMNYYYNDPLYIISYKRIFKSNAIRLGIGGTAFNSNSTVNDTLKNNSKTNTMNIGLGLEHYCYVGKRWNLFFGADLVTTYMQNNYLQQDNATNSFTQKTIRYGYGVSPLLGIQFKINRRLSISTEANYTVLFTKTDTQRTYQPTAGNDSHEKANGLQTTFNAPVGVNFRFHF